MLSSQKKGMLAAIVALLFYGSAFGIAGYEVSLAKGEIWDTNFTISQSLAFGNDPALVSCFTVGLLAYMYLIMLKGPKHLLYPRLLALLIAYVFLVTIIWITTFRDTTLHYTFASVIFGCTLLYHIITYLAYRQSSASVLLKRSLLGVAILNVLVTIALILVKVISPFDEEAGGKISFAALENTVTVLTGTVIALLGFLR